MKRARTDGARYAACQGVSPEETVDELIDRWVGAMQPGLDSLLAQLSLVPSAAGAEPSAAEEAAAEVLNPRLTLRAARVEDGSSLLVQCPSPNQPGALALGFARGCARFG